VPKGEGIRRGRRRHHAPERSRSRREASSIRQRRMGRPAREAVAPENSAQRMREDGRGGGLGFSHTRRGAWTRPETTRITTQVPPADQCEAKR